MLSINILLLSQKIHLMELRIIRIRTNLPLWNNP